MVNGQTYSGREFVKSCQLCQKDQSLGGEKKNQNKEPELQGSNKLAFLVSKKSAKWSSSPNRWVMWEV
jgi:hypothetical protein